jgi:hypothetical protein
MSIRIGIGIKPSSVYIIVAPNAPTGLTLTLISGGVKVDWTDNSGGAAQTEIWGRSDSGTSALLYTIAAGIVTKNDICTPVDLRYYKVRSLQGVLYSAFTAEVSIAMVGIELINQTAWYTAAYWNTYFQASWSAVGITLVSNGTGFIGKGLSFWTIGKTYRISVTVIVTSGNLPFGFFALSTNVGANIATTGTHVNYFLTDGGSVGTYGTSFVGSITALSIKEVLFP